MEEKTKYQEYFEKMYIDKSIHVKFVHLFLIELKKYISNSLKSDDSTCKCTIIAEGTEYAYYWPGINAIEGIMKAFGYDVKQMKYKIGDNNTYEYEWKIKKLNKSSEKDKIDFPF